LDRAVTAVDNGDEKICHRKYVPDILPQHPEKYHRLPVVVRVYSYRVRVIIRVRILGLRVEIDVRV